MAKATIYARSDKDQKSPSGATLVPLYMRFTHQGDRARMSLDIKVRESLWNEDSERVSSSHDNAVFLNQQISDARAAADKAIAELSSEDVVPEPSRVKDYVQAALNGEDPREVDFLGFCWDTLEGYRDRGQTGTYRSYRGNIRKLEEFWEDRHSGTLTPRDLTVSLVREWRDWMYEVKDNSANTVGHGLMVLRVMYNKAQQEGHIDRQRYIWDHITIDSEDVEKDLPTWDEFEDLLGLWDKWKENLDHPLWKPLSYFLAAYYAGGMRFGDVAFLQWDHLPGWPGEHARIKYKMQKTSGVSGMPVVGGLREILDIFDNRREDGKARVFPILDGRDTSTPDAAHDAKQSVARGIYRDLSDIADIVGIDHLTFHMSRNLAAYRYYRSTGDIYETKEMLGHHSVEQTEQYLSGFGVDMDDSFRNAFG